MKTAITLFTLFIVTTAQAQFSYDDFDLLYRLKGKWKMEQKQGYLIEEWKKSEAGILTGRSYTVNGLDTVLQETARLLFQDGKISFNPTVVNQNEGKEVSFSLLKIDNGKFFFVNEEHNFPQRVTYQIKKDSLSVVISGNTSNGFREIPFLFTRVD